MSNTESKSAEWENTISLSHRGFQESGLEKKVRIRKEHRCDDCREFIPPGSFMYIYSQWTRIDYDIMTRDGGSSSRLRMGHERSYYCMECTKKIYGKEE
jgi:hypothetical protein